MRMQRRPDVPVRRREPPLLTVAHVEVTENHRVVGRHRAEHPAQLPGPQPGAILTTFQMHRTDAQCVAIDCEVGLHETASPPAGQPTERRRRDRQPREHQHPVATDPAADDSDASVLLTHPRLLQQHGLRSGGDLLEHHHVGPVALQQIGQSLVALLGEEGLVPHIERRHGQFGHVDPGVGRDVARRCVDPPVAVSIESAHGQPAPTEHRRDHCGDIAVANSRTAALAVGSIAVIPR